MTHWSRLLSATFGGVDSVDRLTVNHVDSLVRNSVVEHEELEFKGGDYRQDETVDLACDVASLANRSGGLILLGVTQDDRGVASGTPGVDAAEPRCRRLEGIIGQRVTPYPSFSILPVVEAGSDRGVIVIAVERSANPPVAALVDIGPRFTLRYPVRSGTTTRFLSEPEIARAYRDREQSRIDRRARLEAIWTGLRHRLSGESVWMAAAFVPDTPGQLIFTREFVDALSMTWPLSFPLNQDLITVTRRAMVTRGRICADGSSDSESPVSSWLRFELMEDGSSLFAWRIGATAEDDQDAAIIIEYEIARSVLGVLQVVGHLTRDKAGLTGVGTLRCGLVLPGHSRIRLNYGSTRFHVGRDPVYRPVRPR